MTDTPQVLLEHYLKQLRLPTMVREYPKLAEQCAKEAATFEQFLLRLVELEMLDRERRSIERRIKSAQFPVTKSLETYNFLALPKLNKKLVMELARGEWITKRENVLAVGQLRHRQNSPRPGTGLGGMSARFPPAIHNRGFLGARTDRGAR